MEGEDGNWNCQPGLCQQTGWPRGARGKGRYPDAKPPPQLESCLGGQGGEVAERGEGGGGRAGKTGPGYRRPEKDLIGSRREHSC